jgi:hypothetical protein
MALAELFKGYLVVNFGLAAYAGLPLKLGGPVL